jgi:cytochrome c oxidase cbb3-type subunit 4
MIGEPDMTYEQATQFAQTWGLALLVVLFVGVLLYALWPGNRDKFKRAAHTPLNEENDDGRHD